MGHEANVIRNFFPVVVRRRLRNLVPKHGPSSLTASSSHTKTFPKKRKIINEIFHSYIIPISGTLLPLWPALYSLFHHSYIRVQTGITSRTEWYRSAIYLKGRFALF